MNTMNKININSIIFGNSHPSLVKEICNHLDIDFQQQSNCSYFANNEVRPIIKNSVRGQNVYIIQTGVSCNKKIKNKYRSINDYIIETLLLITTCRRSNCNKIVLIMPHFPYARQDKKESPRAAISASDICNLFYKAGVNEFVSFDLHNRAIQGFIPCSFNNIPCFNIIKNLITTLVKSNNNYFCLAAPDESAALEISKYSSQLKIPMVYFCKKRDYNKENIVTESKMIGNKKYIENRTIILIDDMVDTAGTMCKASDILVKKGAKDIIIIATHGILSNPAIDRINKCESIKQIFVSDSIPQDRHIEICKKIQIFSISNVIADIILRIENNKSVSESYVFK